MDPKDTWEKGSIPALSGAGDWSVQGSSADPPAGDGDPRYERRGLLGVGGMGKVFVARDHRLRREVALKVAKDPEMARRMTREAWITAQLEHPGIVPIYDAGATEEGQLFYTMRLIRGRSLSASLEDCGDLGDRLALLTHFQAAAQAVAYAHSLGIVHRDLKPANILVGEFGETQVADWGLARPLMDAEGVWETESAVTGTPRYMAPEQARGERVDARADVWALGVLLWELLSGQPPFEGMESEALMSGLREGRSPLPSSQPAEVPEELFAITRKATDPRPERRYSTARELAQDVGRYLNGRRVQAHAYSTGELLARVLRQWRAPLAVGLLGACGLAVMGGLLQKRITSERDLARAALAEADASLSRALASQAVAAAKAQARPEAELLAAHALAHGESPIARGVLAAYGRVERPRLLERRVLPEHCQGSQTRISPDGQWLLCSGAQRMELRSTETLELVWKVDDQFRTVWWRDGWLAYHSLTHDYVEVDLATGEILRSSKSGPLAFATVVDRNHLVGVGPNTFSRSRIVGSGEDAVWEGEVIQEPCTFSTRTRTIDDRVLIPCNEGDLFWLDDDNSTTLLTNADDLLPFGALTRHGDSLLVGSLEGRVAAIDLETGETTQFLEVSGLAVNQIVPVPGSRDHAVVIGEGGGPQVWNTRLNIWQNSLPGHPDQMGPGPNPHEVLLIGEELERWHIPATMGASMIRGIHGYADVEVDPQGVYIATADGGGFVTLREANTGRIAYSREAPGARRGGVAKFIAFSADGMTLMSASIWARTYTLDRSLQTLHEITSPGRRGGILADGSMWVANYTTGPRLFRDETGPERRLDGPEVFDGVTTPSGRYAAMLSIDEAIWLLDSRDGSYRRLFGFDQPRTVELSGDAQTFWVGTEEKVCRLSREGASQGCADLGSKSLVIALSPDETLLAVGTTSGTVLVLGAQDLALRAELRGHELRTPAVSWSPDGQWLVSGSWDQSVRFWSVEALDRPANQLIPELEQAWSMGLEEALERF